MTGLHNNCSGAQAVFQLHDQDPFDFLTKLRQQNIIDKKVIHPF